MYDINHDGIITYDEMLQIVQSVYKMVGQMIEFAEDEATPEMVCSDQLYFHAGMYADKKVLGGIRQYSEWTKSSK